MIWLLGGYMWLFIHRPFEVWPALGALQIERGYMLVMILVWMVTPGKSGLSNRIHAALGGLTLALLAAWLLSPYADMDGVTDVVESYFKVAVFYVLVVTTVRDERGLRRLGLAYLGAVSLYAAHSLLEFVGGRHEFRQGISRMIGVDVTYSDPNAFASTLLYSLPLALAFWLERPRRLPRILMLGFFGAICGCILLTGSRAGMVGLLFFGLIVLWIAFTRKGLFLLAGTAAAPLVVAVLSLALPEELQNRYLTLVDSSFGPPNAQSSAEGRLVGFEHGLRAWQRSPLVGHGPASFALASGLGSQAHNLYGQVLSELGLLGALALLGLVGCFTFNWLEARRLYREHPEMVLGADRYPRDLSYHLAGAMFINLLLLLLMGWAGHTLYRYNWQWFAAFQAVALHCVRLRAQACEQAACYSLPDLVLPRARPQPRGRAPAPEW